MGTMPTTRKAASSGGWVHSSSITVLGLVSVLVLSAFCTRLAAQTGVFRRGDFNTDGVLDIADAVGSVQHLFTAGVPGLCRDAADTNDDGALTIVDPLGGLFFLFGGQQEPPAPGLDCGVDPTEDSLSCFNYAPCGHSTPLTELARLRPAEGCDNVLDELRESLINTMNRKLDENLEIVLRMVRDGFCDPWLLPGFPFELAVTDIDFERAPPGGGSAEEFSETNNQVSGVDEADFVKNDGSYIYILADNKFQIVDAWPASEAHRLATVDVEGTPTRLFVHNNRAFVYSSLDPLGQPQIPGFFSSEPSPTNDCTYGYDCDFKGDGRKLKVTVFDISNRNQPTLVRELVFSGSYLNSRRIEDVVHTVVVFPEIILPNVVFWPPELEILWAECWSIFFPFTEEEVNTMFERLRESNLETINNASLADFLPSIRDTRYIDGTPETTEELIQNCESFFLTETGDGEGLLSLVTLPIGGSRELDDTTSSTIIGRPGAVYASQSSLFIATRHYSWQIDDGWFFSSATNYPEATTIHKFDLSPDGSSYLGSSVVKGRVLNQFAMDEYEGHLRIATTTGRVPSPDVHSTISVVDSRSLELVGQVDNIAPTEDIRSVRFNGETSYIVTFKKTDPLFVIDLSKPRNPIIRGELKIPGFSTYMHMLDDNHILSMGYDADDQGSFAWFTGILLQIIDVTNPEDPTLAFREVIGSRGSTSDAATNHLAFNFFPPRDLLAIPMVICEDTGGGGSYGDTMTFSGLMVYHVTAKGGFSFIDGVPHDQVENIRCNNWWTRSNSQVKRSVFMDDFVFSITLEEINVAHLENLANPVANVSLTE